jgi:hypothetical protein
MKCILLGSGPEMTRINDVNIEDPDIRIIGLNNVWKGTDKWNYLISPADYPHKGELRKRYHHKRREFESGEQIYYFEHSTKGYRNAMKHYSHSNSWHETCLELGYTSYFGLMYWTIYYLQPDEIGCLGLNHNFTPDKDGATTFYGPGYDMQTRGTPDLVHQINTHCNGDWTYVDKWFKNLENHLGETKCYNLSNEDKSILPWQRKDLESFINGMQDYTR